MRFVLDFDTVLDFFFFILLLKLFSISLSIAQAIKLVLHIIINSYSNGYHLLSVDAMTMNLALFIGLSLLTPERALVQALLMSYTNWYKT